MLDDLAQAQRAEARSEFGDPEIATRIAQYEMAYRMQTSVPELTDFSDEPQHVLDMYGPDVHAAGLVRLQLPDGPPAGRSAACGSCSSCTPAGTSTAISTRSSRSSAATPTRPSAALVKDLKQRGLLDDTLVIWGGEFGRTPFLQGKIEETEAVGPRPSSLRLHRSGWPAAASSRASATARPTTSASTPSKTRSTSTTSRPRCCTCLGIDHTRLTYKFQGRYFRLTDVHGEVVKPLLA